MIRAVVSLVAGLLAALWTCEAICSSDAEDFALVISKIAKEPMPGIPSGPYSSWSEQDKKSGFHRIGLPCAFVCGEALGQFKNEALLKAAGNVCLMECIVSHLPQDHPMMAKTEAQLDKAYDEVHRRGLPLPRLGESP